MNKLTGIISSMNYRELKAVQKDLYEGNIGRIIKHNLDRLETRFPEKVCPTCGNPLNEQSAKYTLTFGPVDFKQRASFCGVDCLTFFVKKIGEEENKIIHNQE